MRPRCGERRILFSIAVEIAPRPSYESAPMPKKPLTARTADRHRLYEWAVQCPEAEIDFVDRVYRKARGRHPARLREDFCGTACSSCEWVKRRATNTGIGVDLHAPTLRWARLNNLAALPEDARSRLTLLQRDVREPSSESMGMDAVLAMNFSYFVFKRREVLLDYFISVRTSLAPGGLFFLDHYGGWESMKVQKERRRQRGYVYEWDQAQYDPITGDKVCYIHFEFSDGSRMERAFTYHWRLWTLPELQEVLTEAGFSSSTVYWEGNDGKGGGDGVFKPRKRGEPDASFICYIVAEP